MILILYSEDYSIKDSNCCSNSFTRLGYSLRTLSTLSQVTGYPIYRVSMYMSPDSHMKIAPNNTNKRTEKRMEKRIKKAKPFVSKKSFFGFLKLFYSLQNCNTFMLNLRQAGNKDHNPFLHKNPFSRCQKASLFHLVICIFLFKKLEQLNQNFGIAIVFVKKVCRFKG